jgi:hypothetical protein
MTNPSVARSLFTRTLPLLILFFGTTVLLQILSGAYHAEFAGYPDESAHYVTSLMVRDFISGLDYSQPMNFARDYYAHYPKVALGHWPPLFYALAGPWMLLFSAARVSVLLGMALLTTVLALITAHAVEEKFGRVSAVISGLLLTCLPLIQLYSDEVMAESLLAIVSFLATLRFSTYLSLGRWQDSAMFGVYSSLAILTKGNGWDLALIPPFAILLTRKYSLVTKWTFWLPAFIVVVACAPWQWMTFSMAQRGWGGGDQPTLGYTAHALIDFIPMLIGVCGWGLTILVLIGVFATVVFPYFDRSIDPGWATVFTLIPAAVIFHSIVPAGVEGRKLIIAVPALILFLFAGTFWVAARFRFPVGYLALAAVVVFFWQEFSIPTEIHYGYAEAARYIHGMPDLQTAKILVSSNRDGEGMLVSELAMAERRPGHQVLRGTKVLARTDWNGNVFERPYQTAEALIGYIHDAHIGLVVTDDFAGSYSFDHQKLLKETIAQYPDHFALLGSFHGDFKGAVGVYRVN